MWTRAKKKEKRGEKLGGRNLFFSFDLRFGRELGPQKTSNVRPFKKDRETANKGEGEGRARLQERLVPVY